MLSTRAREGVWDRVSRLVGRRPRVLWVTITVGLLVCAAAFLPQLKASGTSQSAVFLSTEDSVVGQDVLAEHFPAGLGSPVQVLADDGAQQEVVAAARGAPGVVPSSVAPVTVTVRLALRPRSCDGHALIQAPCPIPRTPPRRSARSCRCATRCTTCPAPTRRSVVSRVQADTEATSEHDRTIVIPLVLIVILLVLMVLLRAIVAPLLLVATVVLSFTATLGIAALVFNHVFPSPAPTPRYRCSPSCSSSHSGSTTTSS